MANHPLLVTVGSFKLCCLEREPRFPDRVSFDLIKFLDYASLVGKRIEFPNARMRFKITMADSMHGTFVETTGLDVKKLKSDDPYVLILEADSSENDIRKKVDQNARPCPSCGSYMTLLFNSFVCGSCHPSGPAPLGGSQDPPWLFLWSRYASGEPASIPRKLTSDPDDRFRMAYVVLAWSSQDPGNVIFLEDRLWGRRGLRHRLSAHESRWLDNQSRELATERSAKDHDVDLMVCLVSKDTVS